MENELKPQEFVMPEDNKINVASLYTLTHDISTSKEDDPLDEINIIKCKFSGPLARIWANIPDEIHQLTNEVLANRLGPKGATSLDTRLKSNFWIRYDKKSLKLKSTIEVSDVITGVCSRQVFTNRCFVKPMVLAYILRRPATYEVVLEDCLTLGIEKLRDEILTAKLQFPNGHLDPKAAAVFMQALTFIDNRVRGPLAQRLEIKQETKTMNVNINKTITDDRPVSMEELDRKIKDLREKLDGNAVMDIQTHTPDVVALQLEEAPANPMDAVFEMKLREDPVIIHTGLMDRGSNSQETNE